MNSNIAVTVSLIAFMTATGGAADQTPSEAEQLATDFWKASGGENWPKIEEIQFTFSVEQDGKAVFSAHHVWNVANGTDEVKWKDKQGKDHQVTANLATPPTDEEGKMAYGRWVNDSYWLLAPVKIKEIGRASCRERV